MICVATVTVIFMLGKHRTLSVACVCVCVWCVVCVCVRACVGGALGSVAPLGACLPHFNLLRFLVNRVLEFQMV